MEIASNYGRTLSDVTLSGSQRVESQSLGQKDFLRLMIEQMKNQNPLEPQDNSKFFSQIAQFDTLNTMREMADALRTLAAVSELANASALIGRTVTAEVPSAPDEVTGIPGDPEIVVGAVERVTFAAAGPVVHVGGRQIPATLITEVA